MNRWSMIIWLLLVVVASFMLYQVKYEVQNLRGQIASTSKKLEEEREALNVVAAEWAYLNRPDRLQQLAEKYLDAAPIEVSQIAEIEAIAMAGQMQAANQEDSNVKPASVNRKAEMAAMLGEDQ